MGGGGGVMMMMVNLNSGTTRGGKSRNFLSFSTIKNEFTNESLNQ